MIEIFSFVLWKHKKTDDQLLEEEFKLIVKERARIQQEIKEFQFFFFAFWKEKMRNTLGEQVKTDTIDSVYTKY